MAHKQDEEFITGQIRLEKNKDGSYTISLAVNPEKFRGQEELRVTVDPQQVINLIRNAQGLGAINVANGKKLADQAFESITQGFYRDSRAFVLRGLNPYREEVETRFNEALAAIAKQEMVVEGNGFSFNTATKTLTFEIPKSLANIGAFEEYIRANGPSVAVDVSPPFVSRNIKGVSVEEATQYLANLIAKRLSGITFPSAALAQKVAHAMERPISEAVRTISQGE